MLRKIFVSSLAALVIIASLLLHEKEKNKISLNNDLIEISKAKYGIFNVDVWKDLASEIIAVKIDEYDLGEVNREEAIAKISLFLYEAINGFEIEYRANNRKKSLFGIIKNVGADVFSIFDELREYVPELSELVVDYLDDPKNREKLKQFIRAKIDQYTNETFAHVDYSQLDDIVGRYGQNSIESTNLFLSQELVDARSETNPSKWIILSSVVVIILILLIGKRFSAYELLISLFVSFTLLTLGLFLPMIDIDARISDFSFSILGEPVIFKDQILYFKSKSIIEVVQLMLAQSKIEVLIVGLLVFTFSVLFPLAKIIASCIYLFHSRYSQIKWINFFVFKSGKWSMADVMVVAIFMSYIGFASILTEQLDQLEKLSSNLQILTTNKSLLNTGFFMFFNFVCLGLVISDKLSRPDRS